MKRAFLPNRMRGKRLGQVETANVLSALIREHVDEYRDVTRWGAGIRVEAQHRARLSNVARRWDDLADIAEAS